MALACTEEHCHRLNFMPTPGQINQIKDSLSDYLNTCVTAQHLDFRGDRESPLATMEIPPKIDSKKRINVVRLAVITPPLENLRPAWKRPLQMLLIRLLCSLKHSRYDLDVN